MEKVGLRTYGKINIGLWITGRQGELHTLYGYMSSVSLSNDISVSKSADIRVIEDGAEVSPGCAAYRAVEAYSKCFGTGGAIVQIEKRGIPRGAGLGGSSADAAATLVALERLYGFKPSVELLLSVGSDVPFMYEGGLARVEDCGDKVSRLNPIPFECLVLVPHERTVTADVFAKYDEFPFHIVMNDIDEECERECVDDAMKRQEIFEAVSKAKNRLTVSVMRLSNELMEFAVNLRIKCKEANTDGNSFACLMSGSGSAFVVFAKKGDFERLDLTELLDFCEIHRVKSVEKGVDILFER